VIRVLVADDHAVVREGLRRILDEHADFRVAAEAATGDEVLRVLAETPVDVLVLDISMPGPGAFDLLQRLREDHPAVRTVVLTMYSEDQYAVRVLRAGAAGFLSKEQSPELLIEAIRKAHGGGVYVSPSLAERLAANVGRRDSRLPHESLSDRELEVLVRIGAGQSIKAIASELKLSPKTVSTYHTRIRKKLNLQTDAELIRYALEHGLTASSGRPDSAIVGQVAHPGAAHADSPFPVDSGL
jgi:two-component system invasion response regulator UvrY